MKNWYKFYCSRHENGLGEDVFAMDLSCFWKFLKENKVLDYNLTIASINRIDEKAIRGIGGLGGLGGKVFSAYGFFL